MSIRIDICIQAALAAYFRNITSGGRGAKYCFLSREHELSRDVRILINVLLFSTCILADDDDDNDDEMMINSFSKNVSSRAPPINEPQTLSRLVR